MRVAAHKAETTAPVDAPKKRRRKLGVRSSIKLFFTVLLLLILGAVVLAFVSIPKRFNILVIGSDQRGEERGRSDVLMLVSISKSPKDAISILTIPRDTRVEVPGFGMQKITHAYALGEEDEDDKDLGNYQLTKETVENFLDIRVDGTVEITFDSFEQLIDKLGGVTVEKYGKLTGEKALKKVRNRDREGGDFARTEDQRLILTEVINEIRKQNAYQSAYAFLKDSSESRIILPKNKFIAFAAYAFVRRGGNVSLKGVHNDVIPGSGDLIYTPEFGKDLYYWIPDEAKTTDLVNTWFS